MDLTVCAGCYKRIEGTFVRAFGQAWHDICFKCGKCRYPIRDTKYASDNNTPFHGDCLALLRGEVCNKCSKPITGTVTTALGKKWHPDCFLCGSCGLPILTSQFSARDGISFHIHCQLPTELPTNIPSEVRNSNAHVPASPVPPTDAVDPVGLDVDVCHGCYQVIRGGITTTALGKTWHPECFKCGKCGLPVRENKFKTEGLVPYHINCKLADNIRICRGCYQVIEGTEITEAMDELWHPECFKCHNCGLRIHGREFTREGIHPIHLHCKRNDLNSTNEEITMKRAPQLSPNSTPAYFPTRPTSPVRSISPVRGFSPTQNMTSPPTRKLRDDNNYRETLPTSCKRCGQLATGTVCFALGATFHPECFTCGNCGLPIMDQEFLNGAMPFHKNCINNLVIATNTIKLI